MSAYPPIIIMLFINRVFLQIRSTHHGVFTLLLYTTPVMMTDLVSWLLAASADKIGIIDVRYQVDEQGASDRKKKQQPYNGRQVNKSMMDCFYRMYAITLSHYNAGQNDPDVIQT